LSSTPPHDITGQEIAPYLPTGKGSDKVIALMENAQKILKNHNVNRKRVEMGKLPANSIWLWGQGKRAYFPLFKEKHHLKGATVAAVDLVKGISKLIGFDTPYVEGATGYIDTDYYAKAKKAMELLQNHDIVYIHVEAPDEASHNGNVKEKIQAIENIDEYIVGALFKKLEDRVKFLIVTDHATPISMKTHYATPVPFVIFNSKNRQNGCQSGYDECSGNVVLSGEKLIEFFLRG
jgi:2,3-bisphosphoglycerate-independent phosphoglycerate mutase